MSTEKIGNSIDPMVGWYDRMLAEGDEQKLNTLRNIPTLVGYELSTSIEKYKEHCVLCGYGSRETMDTLFRVFDESWEEWKPGDIIVWADGKYGKSWPIERIRDGYVWWRDDVHGEQMTRDTNLLRVKKVE